MDLLRFFACTKCLMQKSEVSRIWISNQSAGVLSDLAFRCLQVAALELSESWSYFIEQERQVSHASALTHDAVRSQKFNRALSVRREGVKQPHATANQNCAPKAALQSSASSYQIPTFQAPKDLAPCTTSLRRNSLRAGFRVPVVPHKAVAEVSKIGNL